MTTTRSKTSARKSTGKKTTGGSAAAQKPTKRKSTASTSRRASNTRNKQPSLLERTADLVVRKEVLGLFLVALSVLTLLSLMTGSRGKLTEAWIDLLYQVVGLGAWGIPLVIGAIGVWLIIHSIDQMPDMPWQRPLGLLLILVAYIAGSSLFIRSAPERAGGELGSWVSGYLVGTIGDAGTWVVVSVLVITGVVLITDRMLVSVGYELWWRLQDWRNAAEERKKEKVIQPPLPLVDSRLPWWKRLRERFGYSKDQAEQPAPAKMVTANPQPPIAAPAAQAKKPNPQPQPTSGASPTPGTLNSTIGAPPSRSELGPTSAGKVQKWELPRLVDMLNDWDRNVESDDLVRSQGRLIQETLGLFGVPADFEGAYKGPSVTQYLIKPGYVERTVRGEQKRVKVKVSKIATLSNDLALALAAPSVRIEAPVPGTNYVGVEVPNLVSNIVGLKELMESEAYVNLKGKLPVALGEDVKGQPIVTDLTRMPHLLIAGATGSGKSVCINSLITCLLLTHTPDTLRLLMIDPKMVELNIYNGAPHLLSPVVTEVDRAAGVLFWAVKEMERRYQIFSQAKARDINRYNEHLQKRKEKPLPYIVIIVDEMADLMMASPEEVEKHVCRLAQMARAVGIHLIIATQRPSVDVITGLIKANFPARIAFAVSSQVDSRVILDAPGADRLLGHGDMLFMPPDASKLERVQGAYVSDDEIMRVVRYWKGADHHDMPSPSELDDQRHDPILDEFDSRQSDKHPLDDLPGQQNETEMAQPELFQQIEQLQQVDARDELYDDAVRIVQASGRGSVSLLQRKLRIGYGRSSRLIDQLEADGILGPDLGGNLGRELLSPPEQSIPAELISEPPGAIERDDGSEESSHEDPTPPPKPSEFEVAPKPPVQPEHEDEDAPAPLLAGDDEPESSEVRSPRVWM